MAGRWFIALSAMFLLATPLLADLPGGRPRQRRPEPPQPVNPQVVPTSKTTVEVKIERADLGGEGKNVRAKIAIPRKVLDRLAPAMAAYGSSDTQTATLPWWSTVIAGVALSIGAASLVFMARGNKAARVAGIVGVLIAALASGYAIADIRLPEQKPAPPTDGVVLEVVDKGEVVILTLPRDLK